MEELTTARMRLLKQGIDKLPFSKEFKERMVQHGFITLEHLSKYRVEELQQIEGFNTLMIHEYGGYMVRHGLGQLINP